MSFPLPDHDEQRIEELRRHAVRDTLSEKPFDNITKLAARIFKVPIAAVTLTGEVQPWFGVEARELGRYMAFCEQAILGARVMVVPDALEDPRFAGDPLVTGAPHLRFYAGAPLLASHDRHLGTLCIADTKPRKLTKDNIDALTSLATLVVDEIQLRYETGERRRAAETLRLLQAAMQQSSESIIITTAGVDLPGAEIVFVNPAFTALTGYSAAEVLGRPAGLLHGPKTNRTIVDVVNSRLSRGEEFRFDAVNYRKDGSDMAVTCHISPIRGENGIVTHFICFQRDATERNRAAAVVEQAKEEAERANRAKSEFLSRMSHELRTPLHAILGFAQLLEIDGQSIEDAESVAQIARAGNHLLELINEVLDIARLESGKSVFTSEAVNVRESLEETLSLVKPLAAKRRVRLEPVGGDSWHVLSNPQRFKQVVLNLLSNAVKFNREGGTVAISCARRGDRLRILVADTGPGISADNIAKLFTPFERLDVLDSGAEGAGLGLSLSKHLIEAMDGTIGVESVLGQGATFWVELPVVHGPPALVVRCLDAPIPTVAEPPRSMTPRTLLYIEDNPSNLRLVERILARRPEVTLISAAQGRLALGLALQHLPDLVLLDLHLPDIQGDEVLRLLRADPATKNLRIVMISADATAVQIERLRAASADDYLTKPIDVRKLLALVDATESHRAEPAPAAGA